MYVCPLNKYEIMSLTCATLGDHKVSSSKEEKVEINNTNLEDENRDTFTDAPDNRQYQHR